MRIISQDGKFDMPYEIMAVSISNRDAKKIIAWSVSVEADISIEMAEYSTEEKALKAMDMMHTEYQYAEECRIMGTYVSKPVCAFQFPQEDEIKMEE